jgi:hypothetical protein
MPTAEGKVVVEARDLAGNVVKEDEQIDPIFPSVHPDFHV